MSGFRETVAVFFDEAHPIGIGIVHGLGNFLIIYTENTHIVSAHTISVISDVMSIGLLRISITDICLGAYEFVSPNAFGL